MTRSGFLKKYALRLAVTLAMLGLIVYTVAHAMNFNMGNVLTTPARRITDTQITSGEAYLFRTEVICVSVMRRAGVVRTLPMLKFIACATV